jgi:hypothetical protein
MLSRINFREIAVVVLLALCVFSLAVPAPAKVLRGGLSEESYRLVPQNQSGRIQSGKSDTRISRTPSALRGSAVDSTAFAGTALTPQRSPLSGVLDTNEFAKPPQNFDIGAERNSREMMLAWERWHKQLSQAIYERWQAMAEDPGKATVKIFVTKNRQISAQILRANGAPAFEGTIMNAIMSLNGNPGLTFPAKSLRQSVSFEADYIAGANVTPGYSWVKNDYEKIREDY